MIANTGNVDKHIKIDFFIIKNDILNLQRCNNILILQWKKHK
jgi:hypothetical protein